MKGSAARYWLYCPVLKMQLDVDIEPTLRFIRHLLMLRNKLNGKFSKTLKLEDKIERNSVYEPR